MTRTKISTPRLLWLLGLGIILFTGITSAQIFQAADGNAGFESGRGGVAPFPGGYYSVGHTQVIGGLANVYVVQTDLLGAVMNGWTYDFGGNDFGLDIERCANGDFVITGVTNTGGSNDIFVLRINPAGGVVWSRIIGTVNEDVGVDVMQAANGHIIMAGWINGGGGNRDAIMVRLTGAGGLVFSQVYVPAAAPNNDDYFHGLWEAGNGDLLLCGGTSSFGNANQGWIVRTNAVGVPAWSRHLGGANSDEEFHSITQLTVGAQAGDIVAVGSTTGVAGDPLDFYMVKLSGVGALIGPDITGGTQAGREEMFHVRENLVVHAGTIILTGRMNPGPFGLEDGYAVEMQPVWNCPVWNNWSLAYGGAGDDALYSGQEVPVDPCYSGYIMCGRTSSPGLVPAGDPQQHYLIKSKRTTTITTPPVSGCNEIPPADRCTQPNFPIAAAPLAGPAGPGLNMLNPAMANMNLGAVLCVTNCPPPVKVNFTGTGNVMQALAAAFPNPVAAGSTFQIGYIADQEDEASIVASDIMGRIVYDETQRASAGAGSLKISTEGWAPGMYAVRVDLGGETRMQQIVVLDK